MASKRKIIGVISSLFALIASQLLTIGVVFAVAPTLTTDAATEVTSTTAQLNASMTDLGGNTGYLYLSFEYATDDYYTNHGSTYDKKTGEQPWDTDNGITTFQASIISLINNTKYHFRAVVRYGTTKAYGADANFTTAILSPDRTPDLFQIRVFRNLLEADDILYVIYAEIPYAVAPTIPVNQAYFWTLIDNSGDVLGSTTGYAYYNLGYGQNLWSLYFVAADGLTWGSEYDLRLNGNYFAFSNPPIWNYTVSTGDYSAYTTQADNQLSLAEYGLYWASRLENAWQINLLDEQDKSTNLSANGEKFFRNAIFGIQYMAPNLFVVQNETVDASHRAWGSSLSDIYKARLAGADGVYGTADDNWVYSMSLEPTADLLNIPVTLLLGIFCVAGCVFAIYKSNQKFQNPMPGYMASILVVTCCGVLFLGFTIIGLVALALVVTGGWLLFMRKA
jgi:hypothetical protein